jgi:hypothetical protein
MSDYGQSFRALLGYYFRLASVAQLCFQVNQLAANFSGNGSLGKTGADGASQIRKRRT